MWHYIEERCNILPNPLQKVWQQKRVPWEIRGGAVISWGLGFWFLLLAKYWLPDKYISLDLFLFLDLLKSYPGCTNFCVIGTRAKPRRYQDMGLKNTKSAFNLSTSSLGKCSKVCNLGITSLNHISYVMR